MQEKKHLAAVVGAGPAGLFAARELAKLGAQVYLFNRDIKPGGLAEYGIFPNKLSMKQGLRRQFQQVLGHHNISYFGNIEVGEQGDLGLNDLRSLGFQSILVTVGAQGTKWLGLPGEEYKGVYHAKDIVYFYNNLPPYSQHPFHFGKHCVIIGGGNVMADIAHYLLRFEQVDEVTVLVRRGPAEVKFDKKEMEYIVDYLDLDELDEEFKRITPTMIGIGQDPQAAKETFLQALPKALPRQSHGRLRFKFLVSPTQMSAKNNNQLKGVEIEYNQMMLKNERTQPVGTGIKDFIETDTVIFAIGDKVDETFGLPVQWNEFAKNPAPRFPVYELSYEAFNPVTNQVIDDVFVAGWARKASHGLVGYARKDGIAGAKAVWQYLQTRPPIDIQTSQIEFEIGKTGKPIVDKTDAIRLYEIEEREARKRGVEEFKFSSNNAMLKAIGILQDDPILVSAD